MTLPGILFVLGNNNKKFYAPFLWMGFNCLKTTVLLGKDRLLLTTKSAGVPSTHLVDLGRIKG